MGVNAVESPDLMMYQFILNLLPLEDMQIYQDAVHVEVKKYLNTVCESLAVIGHGEK